MAEPALYWGTRRIATLPQLAARHGMTRNAMLKALRRAGLAPIKPAPIDQRTPTFYLTDADAALKALPGRGANLRRKQ